MRGRKLGRNSSHRKAMFRNMACSLIRSVRVDEDDEQKPRVPGRIVTTLAKAKELRPFVERLVTLARKSIEHEQRAAEFATAAVRNSDEWKSWRDSDQWNDWNQSIAPAVAYRRRAFAILRSKKAVAILFNELAERFADRPGGYTRVVRLADVRIGDAGRQALIEFVGERDRTKAKRKAPLVAADDAESAIRVDTETEEEAPPEDASDEATEASIDQGAEQSSDSEPSDGPQSEVGATDSETDETSQDQKTQ